MRTAVIVQHDDLPAFRGHARKLLATRTDPAAVIWTDQAAQTLFEDSPDAPDRIPHVPRAFLPLAEAVACHRDPARWSLLYQALWRLDRGERGLLEQEADPLTHRLRRMEIAVRRDEHRMTAFVRFRPTADGAEEHFIAWYEPQHYVLRRASAFFADRFAAMRFSILTPDLTLHWDRQTCRFSPGIDRSAAPPPDAMEDWWKHYYAATFNPARNNPDLLVRHIPRRFWRNLPETSEIPRLTASAASRTARMIQLPEDKANR